MDSIYRDGGTPKPLTDAELEAIRSTFGFYDSTSLVPRLLATIDSDRSVGSSSSGVGRGHA